MTNGILPVSPHICTPVEQEVMVDLLRVPYQTGQLKNLKMTGNILQLDFNYKIFLGVPIIVEGTVHVFIKGKHIVSLLPQGLGKGFKNLHC